MGKKKFTQKFKQDITDSIIDLGLCLDQARRSGVTLPVTALVDQFYGDVQALGGNRWDTSSLIVRFDHLKKQKA